MIKWNKQLNKYIIKYLQTITELEYRGKNNCDGTIATTLLVPDMITMRIIADRTWDIGYNSINLEEILRIGGIPG